MPMYAMRTAFGNRESGKMTTRELSELRHKYKTAYTTYMSCVHALSDACKGGNGLTEETRQREAAAFTELTTLRRALLVKLKEHAVATEQLRAEGAH